MINYVQFVIPLLLVWLSLYDVMHEWDLNVYVTLTCICYFWTQGLQISHLVCFVERSLYCGDEVRHAYRSCLRQHKSVTSTLIEVWC